MSTALTVRPSLFVRMVRATPLLRALIPVENPQEHIAGSDYVSTGPMGTAPSFSVARSMSAYGAFPWVVACVEALCTDLGGLPLRVKVGGERQDNHPVLDLMARPSERTSGLVFMHQWITDLSLTGWAPCLVLVDHRGDPASVVRLHPQRTTIKPTPAGEPDVYVYNHGGGEPQPYRYDDVLCPRRPSWEDDPSSVYGQGAIRALNETLTADLAFQKLTAQAARHGRPAAVVKPAVGPDKAVTTWNPKKVKEVKRAVEKAAGDSHGGIMVLNALLDIETLGWSPRDMEAPKQAELSRETILAAFHVPPSRVGLPTANYATQAQQMKTYWEHLQGLAALIAGELTRLARRWDPSAVVYFDFSGVEALQAQRSERLQRVQLHTFNGLSAADAYRAEGFDELADKVRDDVDEKQDAARGLALDILRSGEPLDDTMRHELIAALDGGWQERGLRLVEGGKREPVADMGWLAPGA